VSGSPLRDKYLAKFRVPNCDDPIFRKWCQLCDLIPGQSYERRDPRIAQLQEIMDQRFGDPTYDPEQDTADDYLTPRGF